MINSCEPKSESSCLASAGRLYTVLEWPTLLCHGILLLSFVEFTRCLDLAALLPRVAEALPYALVGVSWAVSKLLMNTLLNGQVIDKSE